MFQDIDFQNALKRSSKLIKEESEELRKVYDSFFDFNYILISDTGAKPAINREYIYESNQYLKESTAITNAIFDEMFLNFKRHIIENIPKEKRKELLINSFIFENEIFLDKLDDIGINSKQKKNIKYILFIKDKLYNLKYILSKSNTLIVCKKLNKLLTKELQDSQLIFKLIDDLGILTNNFYDFYQRIKNLEESYIDEIDLDLNFLDSFIISETMKISEFIYQNKKYKFSLDFKNLSNHHEKFFIDRVYLENVVSNIIEQACLDIIKKEKYSSKSDRHISIKAEIKQKNLIISCIFDSYYNRTSEDDIFLNDENRSLILAKNLLAYLNGKLEINNKGDVSEYRIIVKLTKHSKMDETNYIEPEREDKKEEKSS